MPTNWVFHFKDTTQSGAGYPDEGVFGTRGGKPDTPAQTKSVAAAVANISRRMLYEQGQALFQQSHIESLKYKVPLVPQTGTKGPYSRG